MMGSIKKLALLVVLVVLPALIVAVPTMGQVSANVLAVTAGNVLVRFNTATPGTVTTIGPIIGLQPGENILGIDIRPLTSELYALGSTSRLYRLNRVTGAATQVGSAGAFTLSGTNFGFDFNPTADRIRITSDADQNLRLNPNDGTLTATDGTLAFAAADPNAGQNPNVVASGYTNSFAGTITTTLYDIDSNLDILVIQNPPNSGTLTTVGPLGVNAAAVNGFDIFNVNNTGYAALNVGGVSGLYTINLVTGAATLVGAIGTGANPYTGLVIEPAVVPNYNVFGLTTDNVLIRFNSARPGMIFSSTVITGLQAGENMLGIDFRPATGELYGLGSTSRLYRINTLTGAATQVGSAGSFTLSGTSFGFDFNPVPDRIRVTSDSDQNLRLNPNDGSLTATDSALAYAAADPNAGANPNIVGSAYTNSFSGSTLTTLYDIDSNLDILTTQNPPNNGVLNTVGPLGVNVTGEVGFDIAVGSNIGFAAFQLSGGGTSSLFVVNLMTGSAAAIGPIGNLPIRDIAVGRSTASGSATATVDFDGDGRTDYSVFRTAENTWFYRRSSSGSLFQTVFGQNADVVTPGDFDGDGKTDIAVWRPGAQSKFYVQRSSDNGVSIIDWGVSGDEPVARDFDGDGRTDYAVVRRTGPGLLVWYILNSLNGSVRVEQFGLNGDSAVPADYDGDGRYDLAVYRGGVGLAAEFYVQPSSVGSGFTVTRWGLGGDVVVPGDYDGDGKSDYAVIRTGTPYVWWVLRSSDGGVTTVPFGASPQFPTPGDYDGDGRTDFSTWQPSNGTFYYLSTASPGTTNQFVFGVSKDYPVANHIVR